MSTIAEFTLPPTEFVLVWAVKTVPDVRIEVERVVVDGTEEVTPYFCVRGESLEAFDDALEDDVTVAEVVLLEKQDGDRFYRAHWRDTRRGILYALSDEVATVMAASYEGETWSIRMLFADQESLRDFHHYCSTYDVGIELERLYERSNPRAFAKFEVTAEQEAALTTALEMGYFEVPQAVTLAEVADRLGISEQATSARLRRGNANLVSNALPTGTESEPLASSQ